MNAGSIPQDAALRLQLAMIAGCEPGTSCFEIRPRDHEGRVVSRKFVRVLSARTRPAVPLGSTPSRLSLLDQPPLASDACENKDVTVRRQFGAQGAS
jgi:hypothetical protein